MTTPLALADVRETDCLRSGRPLTMGRMPGRYVTGVRAVLQRVLWGWAMPKGVLRQYIDPDALTFGEGLVLLEGATLSDRQLLGLRAALQRSASREDFVLACAVPLTFERGVLTVPGRIQLVDGLTYPLEVSLSNVGAALDAIGA